MASDQLLDVSVEGTRERAWRRRRMRRVAVPILFLLVLLASQLAIALYSYRANRREALKLSDEVIGSISERIATEVDAYLTPAAEMVELAGRLALGGAAEPSVAQLAPMGAEMLRAYPQLAMFSIGAVDGSYTGPRKTPDGSIVTQLVERDGGRVTFEGWLRPSPDGSVLREPTDTGYDPRGRPWYRGAVDADGLYWTDPYLFFDPVVPGVTVSQPLRAADGRLLGVAGIDIELAELSRFLAGLRIGERGRAAIVDTDGAVIAHPHLETLIARQSGEHQTAHVAELEDQALLRAFNYFRVRRDSNEEVELDGESYRITSRTLPPSLGGDWVVLMAVPTDDFVGFVGENNRRTLVLSLAVLGVAAVLAALLAVQGIRSDRQAQAVLEQRERLAAQSRALTALGADRGLLDPSDRPALRKLTERAAEATAAEGCSVWVVDGMSLRCIDAYDRTSGGHTEGVELDLRRTPELSETLSASPVLVAAQAVAEPRLLFLYRQYLAPRTIGSALLARIRSGKNTVGLLMLEGRDVADWPQDTVNFAQALAAILAVRFRDRAQAGPAEAPPTAAPPPTDEQPRTAPPVSEAAIERHEDATVLVINCEATARTDDETTPLDLINRIVCCLDAWSERSCVKVVAVLGERIVAAAFDVDPADGACCLAEAALDVQARAHEYDPDDRVSVRMGIHTGDLAIAAVGSGQRHPDLSGPAVRIATLLAALGVRDGVQVSGATYKLIRSRFLLEDRGRFYTQGFGEVNVYYLNEAIVPEAAV